MAKYIWAVLGGGILLGFLVLYFPAIQSVTNSTNASISGNYSQIHDVITFTPLLLWVAVFSIPVVLIAVYLWQRRRAGG